MDLITGFSWVLPCFSGCYSVLLCFISFIGFYFVLLSFYGVLLGFTGFYQFLPDLIVFYPVLLGFIRFYRVLLSCTGFYWVLTWLLTWTEFNKETSPNVGTSEVGCGSMAAHSDPSATPRSISFIGPRAMTKWFRLIQFSFWPAPASPQQKEPFARPLCTLTTPEWPTRRKFLLILLLHLLLHLLSSFSSFEDFSFWRSPAKDRQGPNVSWPAPRPLIGRRDPGTETVAEIVSNNKKKNECFKPIRSIIRFFFERRPRARMNERPLDLLFDWMMRFYRRLISVARFRFCCRHIIGTWSIGRLNGAASSSLMFSSFFLNPIANRVNQLEISMNALYDHFFVRRVMNGRVVHDDVDDGGRRLVDARGQSYRFPCKSTRHDPANKQNTIAPTGFKTKKNLKSCVDSF